MPNPRAGLGTKEGVHQLGISGAPNPCPMPRILGNPGRNFSADPVDKSEAEILRRLLEHSEVADLFDEAIRERIGRAIAQAALDPAKPGW
jgi:hypothetical protein